MARPKQILIVQIKCGPSPKPKDNQRTWFEIASCNTEAEAMDAIQKHGQQGEFRILAVKRLGKLTKVQRLEIEFEEEKAN